MNAVELRNQAYALARSMDNKQANIRAAASRIGGLEEALFHARAAQRGSEELAGIVSSFMSVQWKGVCADSFFGTVGVGSRGHEKAVALSEGCAELVHQMEMNLDGLRWEKRSLERSLAQDRRAYDQKMRQIRKAV